MHTSDPESPSVQREWDSIEALLDHDPLGPDFNTAHEVCRRYVERPGTCLTIVHEDGSRDRWSYAELDRAAGRAARVFADLGLRRGDAVGGLLSRQVESWVTALAAWRSGLVYVPLFGGFAADAVRLRLEVADAKAVVVDGAYATVMRDALSGSTKLDPALMVVSTVDDRPAGGELDFWTALDAATSTGPQRATRADDTATVLFTSGTSGTPKACRMTHGAFVSTLPYVRHVVGDRGPVFSTADPAWAYGLFTTGASVMALGVPRVMYSGPFDPRRWTQVLREEAVAVLATAPAALRRLTASLVEEGAPASLRRVVAAGEPLTATVARAWMEAGGPVVRNGYGLSEVGMALADVDGSEQLIEPGCLTRQVPGFEVHLVDRQGDPVEPGSPGLVAIRRPRYQMSSDYLNVPEQWAARWRGDLFLTEDLATLDEQGRYTIVGRDDDMIIVSGHNISPVEVENAALEVAEIIEAAAVTHADEHAGDVLRLVVVSSAPAADLETLAERVRVAVSSRVGPYAKPRVVDFATELPRTEVGKLRRAALRQS